MSFCYRTIDNFKGKGIDEEIAQIRFKHYQQRQIDLINRLLEERSKLCNFSFSLQNLTIFTERDEIG